MDASMPGLAVENLSQGGMFVRCAAALAVGTRVMVQLVRPGLKRAIPAQGCVVSSIAPADAQKLGAVAGMGIRIETMERDAAERLHDLIDDLACGTPVRAPSPPPPVRLALVAPPPGAPVAADPPPPAPAVEAPAPIEAPVQATMDTSAEDDEARNRLVRQLEDEVVALRRELLRRNRTIADLATRLSVYEPATRRPMREIREVVCRPALHAVDPRAD
jgi:Tfp pilus assembly protein PilZ